MMIRYCVLTMIVVMVAGTWGCMRKPVNLIEWSGPTKSADYFKGRRIYTDSTLSKRLEIENIHTDYDVDHLLRAQIRLRNTTKRKLRIEYQFEWFDGQGIRIDTPASRWVLRQIYGGDSASISASAPNAKAKDFIFKIKKK